jgi:hypothetical protein
MVPTATMERTHETDVVVLVPCRSCSRSGRMGRFLCQDCSGKAIVWAIKAIRPRAVGEDKG